MKISYWDKGISSFVFRSFEFRNLVVRNSQFRINEALYYIQMFCPFIESIQTLIPNNWLRAMASV